MRERAGKNPRRIEMALGRIDHGADNQDFPSVLAKVLDGGFERGLQSGVMT